MAEFAPAELGAALGISYHCACALIGDALDLRHRYPMLWTRLQAGQIKTWAARRIAQTTRHLTVDAAGQVDRVIAPYADRKNPADLVAFAEAEAIRADPDLARQRAEAAKTSRGAWVCGPADTGIARDVHPRRRHRPGPVRRVPQPRRSRPQNPRRPRHRKTNAAPKQSASSPPPSSHSTCTPKPPARPPPRTRHGFPATTVYVHLTDQTLADGDGVARVEGIGPVLTSQIKRLAAATTASPSNP